MNKLLIFLSGITLFVIVYLFLLHGVSFQVKSVEGCYTHDLFLPIDRICLYEGGTYEQLYLPEGTESFNVYNSGGWRSYSTKEGKSEIIGISVNGFFDRFSDSSELDFFPYRSMFGTVLFMVGGDRAGEDRYYIRDN